MDDRVTIIHGPNGYGKTVLLTLINDLFNGSYWKFRETQLKRFVVKFDDNRSLVVKRSSPKSTGADRHHESGSRAPSVIIELVPKAKAKPRRYEVKRPWIRSWSPSLLLGRICQITEGLEKLDSVHWLFRPTGETFTEEDLLERWGESSGFGDETHEQTDKWLRDIQDSIPVQLIDTYRLLDSPPGSRPRIRRDEKGAVLAVTRYSDELAHEINRVYSEYATLSQSLDRTFPIRLITEGWEGYDLNELKVKLSRLEKQRSDLMAAGLLDKDKEIDLRELSDINEIHMDLLSVYIEDAERKLGVFDELRTRVELLLKIVNERFLQKRLSVSRNEGFVFTAEDGRKLSAAQLSSGEQHVLVLFFNLLFDVKPNSLVLIDEPELSLHVCWQQSFLRDLRAVAELRQFDALMATHSPQIIHDRWDLTVELEGPKK